jgi:hypothetical protein
VRLEADAIKSESRRFAGIGISIVAGIVISIVAGIGISIVDVRVLLRKCWEN